MSFEGKVAIVTGSGRETAIGDAIAIALADRGASVTVNYITDASRPREANVVEGIRAKGGKATVVQADISETKSRRRSLLRKLWSPLRPDKIDIISKLLYPTSIN